MTRPTTAELLKYFLYLGSLGFGGPGSSATCSATSSSGAAGSRKRST